MTIWGLLGWSYSIVLFLYTLTFSRTSFSLNVHRLSCNSSSLAYIAKQKYKNERQIYSAKDFLVSCITPPVKKDAIEKTKENKYLHSWISFAIGIKYFPLTSQFSISKLVAKYNCVNAPSSAEYPIIAFKIWPALSPTVPITSLELLPISVVTKPGCATLT